MANHLRHVGVLRPTVPEPEVFWGTIDEVAEHIGVSRRAAYNILDGKTASSRRGHRAMTEEEKEKYYQPPRPKPPKKNSRPKHYSNKRNWYITFFKDWKKGEKSPKEEHRRFSGNPQEFVKFTNCNIGQVYRLINWYEGNEEKYPLKSIKGWTIARIRRYDTPPRNPINRKKYVT